MNKSKFVKGPNLKIIPPHPSKPNLEQGSAKLYFIFLEIKITGHQIQKNHIHNDQSLIYIYLVFILWDK